MTVVRAPASSANLGPGFDCAAVALDLWNELEVSDGEGVELEGEGSHELPTDGTSLVVRAYELLADPAGKRFRCTNRIPLERGLGSSAAAIALGLAAGAAETGERDVERLLELALQLEPHADNLAATLLGGVTLTDGRRAWRVADSLPLAPLVVVPERRIATGESRAALPASVPHADATHTALHAALLGAGLARHDAELVGAALDDRLHEPYRPSEVLTRLRDQLPAGAVGATLSGSGPSVLVWAEQPDAAAAELRERFPDHRVLELAVADRGAL
jgi:homoserine kinase